MRAPVEVLARWGWVAKAAVHGLVAVLALLLAIGVGGSTSDSRGALREIADEPGGGVVIGLIAVGLVFFGAWRIAQAVLAPTGHEGAAAIAVRIGRAVSGLVYLGLAIAAGSLAIAGLEPIGGGGGAGSQAAGVMDWPGGRALVVAAGLVVAGLAVNNGYDAWRASFMNDVRDDVQERARHVVAWVGRIGHAARAIAFGLIAAFVISAGVEGEPGQAIGLEGALAKTIAAPAGRTLLVIFALGLFLYAVHCALMAATRRV